MVTTIDIIIFLVLIVIIFLIFKFIKGIIKIIFLFFVILISIFGAVYFDFKNLIETENPEIYFIYENNLTYTNGFKIKNIDEKNFSLENINFLNKKELKTFENKKYKFNEDKFLVVIKKKVIDEIFLNTTLDTTFLEYENYIFDNIKELKLDEKQLILKILNEEDFNFDEEINSKLKFLGIEEIDNNELKNMIFVFSIYNIFNEKENYPILIQKYKNGEILIEPDRITLKLLRWFNFDKYILDKFDDEK